MQKIIPCLWFDYNAEEAVNFYLSLFKDSKILKKSYYSEAGYDIHGMKAGTAMTIDFELNGQTFTALNGGPIFKFNEAISLMVMCKTQKEIDEYWEKLSEGGEKGPCGWLKDKFGLSWQIVPTIISELFQDSDSKKTERVMNAMLQMKKLDIEALLQAYKG